MYVMLPPGGAKKAKEKFPLHHAPAEAWFQDRWSNELHRDSNPYVNDGIGAITSYVDVLEFFSADEIHDIVCELIKERT